MPQSIIRFVEAQKLANRSLDKEIHVLVINAGMLNSDTLQKEFDTSIDDRYYNLFDAIASVNPITIIDEPHKFKQENATWQNILKLKSQYILRFGATFDDKYENLIHELSAVDAFNQDLVKGVIADIEVFEGGSNEYVKLLSHNSKSSGNKWEARFEYFNGSKAKVFNLIEGESLAVIHPEFQGIMIDRLNTKVVQLSNGLELRVGQKISPYSYSSTIQDKMMAKAVKRHFELELDLLSREVRIKPLTLFFIDDIEGYRGKDGVEGEFKTKFEDLVRQQINSLLKKDDLTPFYREYLERSLADLSVCHGGYFSKDNSEADEAIEKEVAEILHDKESLLSIENPRRFIFSKWTLREGWDNPNVFQICKLRSSGSQTSKLQEVGRGLRLPVNEFMSRVKNEDFYLYYYVDFTEKDFAEQLVKEINDKSGQFVIEELTKLTDEVLDKVITLYPENLDDVLNSLGEAGIIDFSKNFKEGGFAKFKDLYPRVFEKVDSLKKNKVRVQGDTREQATIRVGKYDELRALWEAINQRVILEYKIENEVEFKQIFCSYLLENKTSFKEDGSITKTNKLLFENGLALISEEISLEAEVLPIVNMGYRQFVEELAIALSVNMTTLHRAFVEVKAELDINSYLSQQTIRIIRAQFKNYLLDNAFSKFQVSYKQVSNNIHPTVLTDHKGKPLDSIPSHGLGNNYAEESRSAEQYLFEEVFYDSLLEKENIEKSIRNVTVFTKIPRNSIRIPVAGGGTYSPDFAYVIDFDDGKKQLNLVIETKDKEQRDLFKDEKQKIKHAEKLFSSLQQGFEVKFETQFKNEDIKDILKQCVNLLD